MRIFLIIPAACFLGFLTAFSQDVPPGAGDSQAATGGARPPQANEGFIGRDVPAFDPGSEVMSYDGKLWNINNNRIFRARFEKFLNTSAATSESDRTYRQTIDRILDLISPGKATKQNQDAAFALLKKASEYKEDANLCRTLSDAIYASNTSVATNEKLKRENVLLEKERSTAEWNTQMAAKNSSLTNPNQKDSDVQKENQRIERDARMASAKRKLSEVGQTIENNNSEATVRFNYRLTLSPKSSLSQSVLLKLQRASSSASWKLADFIMPNHESLVDLLERNP